MELLGAVLPIFTYALEKAARYEMEKRVTYISDELLKSSSRWSGSTRASPPSFQLPPTNSKRP